MTLNTQPQYPENNQDSKTTRAFKAPTFGITDEMMQESIEKFQRLSKEAVEIVNKIQKEQEEERKKSYRHTVPESDSVVQFLLSLEERYKNNPGELKLVKDIIVHADTIEIAGYEIKRVNEEAPEDKKKGISKNSKGKTLWKWKAAMDYTETQTGYKCLTCKEWEKVARTIPGKSDGEHSRNAITIFEFSLAGYRSTGGELDNEDNEENIWSSSPEGFNGAFYIYFNKKNNQVERYSIFQNCSSSLRLAKDNRVIKKMINSKSDKHISDIFKEKINSIIYSEEFGTNKKLIDNKKLIRNKEGYLIINDVKNEKIY